MKYIKKFNEEFILDWLVSPIIKTKCEYLGLRDYVINNDNSVDVKGNVNISSNSLTKIPIQFGTIYGYFGCHDNKLTSLKGSPKEVYLEFSCENNMLKSLEYGPPIVHGVYSCGKNKLESLKGSPIKIDIDFYCEYNMLKTLEGGPKEVERHYYCNDNKLISLEGGPDSIINGFFSCEHNPVYKIYRLFNRDYKTYQDSLDYNYLRGTNIIKIRFKEACEEAGIEMPESIPGYKYI